jgi:TamB, inner membrane protein subunit of TAM complex
VSRAGRGQRRRAGRFRRWLVRPFVWALVVLALAVAGIALYLRSDAAAERLRGLVTARLSDALGRPVEVGEVRLGLAPLSLDVRDLVIAGTAAGDRPLAELPAGRVEVSLSGWRRPVLRLERLWLSHPRIYLRFDPDGGNNLPHLAPSGGAERRIEVEVGDLIIEGGEVGINAERYPLELEARGVAALLAGTGDGWDLAGRVQVREALLTLPHARPYPVALDARVTIARGRVELAQGRVAGGELQATVEGSYVWNETERHLHVGWQGDASGEVLSRLGYVEPGQVAGPVRLTGEVDSNGEQWSLHGTAAAARLVLTGRVLTGVETDFTGDPESLRVDVRRAAYAGGGLTGVVRVGLGESPTPVAVDLKVDGTGVRQFFADQGLDLPGLAGRARGDVTYRFTSDDPRGGFGWAGLEVEASQVQGRHLALTGEVDLTVGHGVLAGQAIRLRSPAQRLLIENLQIDLPSGEGRFDYRLDSDDVGPLGVMLPPPPPGEPPPTWLPTAGHGAIEGTVAFGGETGFAAEARFDLAEVVSPGALADHLGGSLSFSSTAVESLRLELSRNAGALLVTGRVPFGEDGAAAEPIDLTVDAAGWPLAEARAFLPLALPVAGPVSGRLHLQGPAEGLSGTLAAAVAPATVAGTAAERLEARLTFDPSQLEIHSLRLTYAAGEVAAEGRMGLGEGASVEMKVEAPALTLAAEPFTSLLGEEVAGSLAVTGSLTGSVEHPRAELALACHDLLLGSRELGEADAVAHWEDDRLQASGSLLGLITFAGGGPLTTDEADLSFHLESADLRGLVRLATHQPHPGLSGSLAGTLRVVGAFPDARLDLQLDTLGVAYAEHRLANLEPVTAHLVGQRLSIDSFYLGEDGGAGEVFVGGDVELAGEMPLDLHFQATAAARWAELAVPQLRLTGSVNALGRVRGTVAAPAVDGQADLEGGTAILAGFPHALEDLRAVALLYPEQLVLDHLDGRLAGGRVKAAGRFDLRPEAAGDYRLQASLAGVHLRYPEGWFLDGDAELSLVPAEGGGRLLRGTVDLDRAYYVEDVRLGLFQLLSGFLRRQRLEAGIADPQLAATQLSVVVNAPGDAVRVKNNVADLKGQAALVVRGSLARPVPVGQVEMRAGGTLVYGEAEYKVDRGLLTFASLDRIDPILDLAATTKVRDYDITLNLSGTLDRLNATFSSDPPLPDLDVLALLTTGQRIQSGGELGGVSQSGSTGAEAFLYGQAATAVTSRVKTLFGFDKFRVDPLASAGGSSVSSARLIVGKQISRDLYVTYVRDPSTNQEDLVRAEWQIQAGVVLVLNVTGGEQYGLDIQWERRF